MLYRRSASNRSASFAGKGVAIVMGLGEVSVMGFESRGESRMENATGMTLRYSEVSDQARLNRA